MKHQSDNPLVSGNLVFPVNYLIESRYHKINMLWQRATICCCMRSSLLESLIVRGFKKTEAISSVDLARAIYMSSVDCQ
jgi:hypothetical protein